MAGSRLGKSIATTTSSATRNQSSLCSTLQNNRTTEHWASIFSNPVHDIKKTPFLLAAYQSQPRRVELPKSILAYTPHPICVLSSLVENTSSRSSFKVMRMFSASVITAYVLPFSYRGICASELTCSGQLVGQSDQAQSLVYILLHSSDSAQHPWLPRRRVLDLQLRTAT